MSDAIEYDYATDQAEAAMDAKDARIAELEEALRPFAVMAQFIQSFHEPVIGMDETEVRREDFIRARRALNGEKG